MGRFRIFKEFLEKNNYNGCCRTRVINNWVNQISEMRAHES